MTSAGALISAPENANEPIRDTAGAPGLLEANASLLLTVGIAAAYIPRLMRSLWVDEAGTYWMACRGPLAAIHRTSHWPGQSILYAVIVSFFCFDGSPFRDLLLRVPSLMGAAAAGYFLYRFAEDAFGAGAGRIAATLFAFSPPTVEFATEARPYTLALAAAAASCWTLHRWVNGRGRKWLLCYVASCVFVIYLHYLFSVIFAVHAVLLIGELAVKRRFFRIGELLAGYAAIALLVLPLTAHIRLLLHESYTLPFSPKPAGTGLGEILMPPLFTVVVFASALVMHMLRLYESGAASRLSPGLSAMLLAWWMAGPLFLFAVAWGTTMQVFALRYVCYSGLALTLLLAYAACSAFGVRGASVWASVLVALITAGNVAALADLRHPDVQELGPFIKVIRDASAGKGSGLPPVLFQSALVESNFKDWRSGTAEDSYLYAPFAAYPMENRLLPLPFQLTPEVKDHIDLLMETDLKNRPEIIFVAHDFGWVSWVTERFQQAGYTYRFTRPNAYWVVVFERHAGTEAR